MALKPKEIIPGMRDATDRDGASAVPVLFKKDLEEHKRSPKAKDRLKRVQALIKSRAS